MPRLLTRRDDDGANGRRDQVLHVDTDPEFLGAAAPLLERTNERIAVETATGVRVALERLEQGFDFGYSGDQGTGLGLSIVREVAEAHGWEVRVTEGEASGARFEFTGVEDDQWAETAG